MITWPAELPLPMKPDFAAQRQEARVPRVASSGPVGWRRRYSAVGRPVQLAIDTTRSECAVFERFFDEVSQGAAQFSLQDPTTDGWPLLDHNGAPILHSDSTPILAGAQWICHFGADLPVIQTYGLRFHIGFSVVVLP